MDVIIDATNTKNKDNNIIKYIKYIKNWITCV
jgi:hypothetical protein